MAIRDACNEIKHKINPDGCSTTADTAVSVDGTWQKRGYSSFNGVVTAILMDSGKIFDSVPLTRYCKSCKLAENFRVSNPDRYDRWRVQHNCRRSAGSMEVEGAKTIFGRSIEKNGLRYAEYFGDGDSKGYMEVKNTYEGITVKKQECVGHVKKRVGNRLRVLKRKRKEAKMAEMKENEPNKTKTKDPLDCLT